jgi:hypothetical protein
MLQYIHSLSGAFYYFGGTCCFHAQGARRVRIDHDYTGTLLDGYQVTGIGEGEKTQEQKV